MCNRYYYCYCYYIIVLRHSISHRMRSVNL